MSVKPQGLPLDGVVYELKAAGPRVRVTFRNLAGIYYLPEALQAEIMPRLEASRGAASRIRLHYRIPEMEITGLSE